MYFKKKIQEFSQVLQTFTQMIEIFLHDNVKHRSQICF